VEGSLSFCCSNRFRTLTHVLLFCRDAIDNMLQGGVFSSTQAPVENAIIPGAFYWANDGNIPKTFDRIADSLTSQVRSGPQSINHTGIVWRTEVYIRVDWPWLAYPAALLTLVCSPLRHWPTEPVTPHSMGTHYQYRHPYTWPSASFYQQMISVLYGRLPT
jgi:hypothetical protein